MNNNYDRYKGKKIELLLGDFFQLRHDDSALSSVGRFNVIYDRASMVAIDPALRTEYIAILGQLLRTGGKILLVTIERTSEIRGDHSSDDVDPSLVVGPPFSIPESEVRRLYE